MASLKQSGTMRDVNQMGLVTKETVELLSMKDIPFLVNSVSYLSESSSLHDIFSAVASDILKTSQRIGDIAAVLESSQDHIVPEITSVSNDLRELLPSHYNPDMGSINIFGVSLRKGEGVHRKTPSQLSEMVYHGAFGELAGLFPFSAFQKITRALRTLDKESIPSLDEPFSKRMNYVSVLTKAEAWKPFVDQVMATCLDIQNYKMTLDAPQKERFLERVSAGRAMVDGVAKSSTYVSREGGVIQISPKHKKDQELISKIADRLQEIPYIKAVEIDQKIPLVKFHDVMVEVQRMNLDVPDAFELKGRLLGAYGACGLMAYRSDGETSFSPSRGLASANLKIVAFDVDFPTSIAHEITHFQDRPVLDEVTGVKQSALRNEIARLMDDKIDRKALSELMKGVPGGPGLMSTLMSDREIIARVGEIGFLLNRYGYQEGESIDSFSDRVRIEEARDVEDDEKIAFDIRMSSPIDEYLGVGSYYNQLIYFNLGSWEPDELQLIKDFTHNYFYKPNPDVTQRLMARWEAGELSSLSINYQKKNGVGTSKTHVSPEKEASKDELVSQEVELAKLLPSELTAFYRKGYETGVFKEGEVLNLVSRSLRRLGDGGGKNEPKKKLFFLYTDQISALLDLAGSIDDAMPADVYIAHRTLVDLATKNYMLERHELGPRETNFDLLTKSMAINTARTWPWSVRDERPTVDMRGSQVMPLPSNFTESELFERYKKVLDISSTRVRNFSPDMNELTHLPLKQQYKIAAMHFMGRASDEFGGIRSERALDYSEDVSSHLSAVALGNLEDRQLASLVDNVKASSTPARFNIREYMAALFEYEDIIAMDLVDSGLLDAVGVSDESIHEYIDHFQAPEMKSRDDKVGRWRWTGNVTPNPIANERLKWFLKGLSYHPANQGDKDRGTSRLHWIGPAGEKPTAERTAMSPLTTFINMIYEKGTNVSDSVIRKALSDLSVGSRYGLHVASLTGMKRCDKQRDRNLESEDLRSVLREHSPQSDWLRNTYFGSEYAKMNDDLSFSSRLSPAGHKLIENAVINGFIDAGKEGKPSTRRMLKESQGEGPLLVIYPGEYACEAVEKGIVAGLKQASLDASMIAPLSNEHLYGYSDSRAECEQVGQAVKRWLDSLNAESGVASAVLQGLEPFGSLSFSFPKNIEGADWHELAKASEAIRLFSADNGVYGTDYRPYIDSLKGEAEAPAVEPIIEQAIEPDVNEHTPKVDNDGVFRPENQLRMF